MDKKHNPPSFVAIGGLGGSGTRVVAQILQKMGFYLGPVLNPQLDSLLFTLLFKRRDWIKSFPTDAEIDRTIDLFVAAMRDGVDQALGRLPPEDFEKRVKLSPELGIRPEDFKEILSSRAPDLNSYAGLAWKEPNTHVFLPQLVRRIGDIKYIHVMRNGLDMALSKNLQQLTNWGAHFGVAADTTETAPRAQLRYWLRTNRRAIEIGGEMPPGQFLLLRYDDLCMDFPTEVSRIEKFLDRPLSDQDMAYLANYVNPKSIGRFRQAPADTFSPDEREAVNQFGFCVE